MRIIAGFASGRHGNISIYERITEKKEVQVRPGTERLRFSRRE
jgi:hypothetical protein